MAVENQVHEVTRDVIVIPEQDQEHFELVVTEALHARTENHPYFSDAVRKKIKQLYTDHLDNKQYLALLESISKDIAKYRVSLLKRKLDFTDAERILMLMLAMYGVKLQMLTFTNNQTEDESIQKFLGSSSLQRLLGAKEADNLQEEVRCRINEAIEHMREFYIRIIGIKDDSDAIIQEGYLQAKHLVEENFPYTLQLRKDAFIQGKDKPCVVLTCYGDSEDILSMGTYLAKRHPDTDVLYLYDDNSLADKIRDDAYDVPHGLYFADGKWWWTNIGAPIAPDYIYAGEETKPYIGNVPVASLPYMDEYTENKEVTNTILEKHDVRVPKFCAFTHGELDTITQGAQVWLKQKAIAPRNIQEIEQRILSVLEHAEKITVKPTDGQAGEGVAFFDKAQMNRAVDYVATLLREGRNVIVEEFITPYPFEIDGVAKDSNLRFFLSKGEHGQPVVSDKVVRVDDKGKPVNLSLTAKAIDVDTLEKYLNLPATVFSDLMLESEKLAIKAMRVLEKVITTQENVEEEYSQDFMGIDIIITSKNGVPVPVVLEVNDHQSGGMWDLDKVTPVHKRGNAVRHVIDRIAQRAKAYHAIKMENMQE